MAAVTGGIDPSVLVAPDYQTQMMQAQRRLQMAQALQEMALKDTPGNGGSVSWTQGLARVLDGLVGGSMANKGFSEMKGANQAYAAGLRSMFGGGAPSPQDSAPQPPSNPAPQPISPQAASVPDTPSGPVAPGLGASQFPIQGGSDPLAPVAPPQAAQQPSPAPNPSQAGGASPWSLTGNPQRDMALYLSNPEKFSEAIIANAGKGAAPTDMEVTIAHAKQALAQGDVATASALLSNVKKQNYIAPATARPGGWTQDPQTGQWMFHPQSPIPGAVPGPNDANGNMTWQVPAGTEEAVAARAQSQAGGTARGQTPYQLTQRFNPQTGQMESVPVSGVLNSWYGAGRGTATSPALGQQSAFEQYGKHSADAFADTQDIAESSPQRVQALREMEQLVAGGLKTGPTAERFQKLAEDHGLPFGYQNNAFVFNKDAARFVAQSAADLGLNGSDARLGMMAHASPNMAMTPEALHQVMPVMIGLEYAKMAKATAASNWAQHDPAGNAKFESQWRQNYDPQMFTAYAAGGPAALAKAPAKLKAKWLQDYRALKGMGVDFSAFAQ